MSTPNDSPGGRLLNSWLLQSITEFNDAVVLAELEPQLDDVPTWEQLAPLYEEEA